MSESRTDRQGRINFLVVLQRRSFGLRAPPTHWVEGVFGGGTGAASGKGGGMSWFLPKQQSEGNR